MPGHSAVCRMGGNNLIRELSKMIVHYGFSSRLKDSCTSRGFYVAIVLVDYEYALHRDTR